MARVGFVGLGVMGAPMATHLIRAGHAVTVWNRTPEKAVPLESQGAQVAPSLELLAEACDTVFTCVGRTEDVAQCLQAMAPAAQPGTLFVDHSTISPEGAKALALDLSTQGLRFMDAPITGGSMGALKGQLTVFCGGSNQDFDEVEPIMAAYSKRSERVGPIGSGQLMKVANQIAVGGALLALCESLAFAKRAGLDIAQTRELLSTGAAGSWAFENYGPKILAEDWSPGFSIKNQRKDFGYAFEAAESLGLPLPGTELVDAMLATLQEQGHGESTTARLFELMAMAEDSE